jgi:hypothetical protein
MHRLFGNSRWQRSVFSVAALISACDGGAVRIVLTGPNPDSVTQGRVITAGGTTCDIRTFGAVGDGVTDDTAAILAANAACLGHLYVPASAGCYRFNGTLTFAGDASRMNGSFVILGDGPSSSCIENTAASSPTIVASAAEGGHVNGVRFTHTAPASGGDGIRFTGVNNIVLLENADFSHNDVGVALTSTYFATVSNVTANGNLSHGMSIVMTGPPGEPIQWQLYNITASANGGDGVFVTGLGAMGETDGLNATGNGGDGMEISSAGGQPGAFRLKNSTFSGNALFGLHIDAAGGDIVSCQFLGNVGGGGIYASEANDNLSLSDIVVSGNGFHGAFIMARSWEVNGGTFDSNAGSGFYAGAGYGRLSSVSASGNTNYGVFIDASVTGATIASCSGGANGLDLSYPASDTVNAIFIEPPPGIGAHLSQTPTPAASLPPLSGLCNVRSSGAVGDGATDDTAAFNAAIAACSGRIFVPSSAGCYVLSGSLSFTGGPFAVVGESQWQSCIENHAGSSPTILATDTTGGVISGLHLTHVGAVSGGDAIRTAGSDNAGLSIQDIYTEQNFVGLDLGPTSSGRVLNVITNDSVSHGIALTGAPLSWELYQVFSAGNGGDGLHVEGSGVLGVIDSYQTYDNENGVQLIGSGGALRATIRNCFIGEDRAIGAVLDTGGGTVDMSTCQFEGEPSGGLFATANNASVNLFALVADNNGGHAVELLSQTWQVVGGNITGSTGSGIVAVQGSGTIFNVRSWHNTGCGVYVEPEVTQASVYALDAHDNGLCATFPAVSSGNTTIAGLVPN